MRGVERRILVLSGGNPERFIRKKQTKKIPSPPHPHSWPCLRASGKSKCRTENLGSFLHILIFLYDFFLPSWDAFFCRKNSIKGEWISMKKMDGNGSFWKKKKPVCRRWKERNQAVWKERERERESERGVWGNLISLRMRKKKSLFLRSVASASEIYNPTFPLKSRKTWKESKMQKKRERHAWMPTWCFPFPCLVVVDIHVVSSGLVAWLGSWGGGGGNLSSQTLFTQLPWPLPPRSAAPVISNQGHHNKQTACTFIPPSLHPWYGKWSWLIRNCTVYVQEELVQGEGQRGREGGCAVCPRKKWHTFCLVLAHNYNMVHWTT